MPRAAEYISTPAFGPDLLIGLKCIGHTFRCRLYDVITGSPVPFLIWSLYLFRGLPVFCCPLNFFICLTVLAHCMPRPPEYFVSDDICDGFRSKGVLFDLDIFHQSALVTPISKRGICLKPRTPNPPKSGMDGVSSDRSVKASAPWMAIGISTCQTAYLSVAVVTNNITSIQFLGQHSGI